MILRFAPPIDTHRRRYLSSLAMVDTGLSVDFTCHGSPAGYGRRDRKRITKPIDRSARDVYYPSFLLSFLPFLFFNRSVYSLYGSQEGILLIEYSVYREARRNTLDRISDRSCSTSHAFATTNQIYLPLVCLLKFFRELTCSWLIDPIKVSRVRPADVLFQYFSFSVLSLSLLFLFFSPPNTTSYIHCHENFQNYTRNSLLGEVFCNEKVAVDLLFKCGLEYTYSGSIERDSANSRLTMKSDSQLPLYSCTIQNTTTINTTTQYYYYVITVTTITSITPSTLLILFCSLQLVKCKSIGKQYYSNVIQNIVLRLHLKQHLRMLRIK